MRRFLSRLVLQKRPVRTGATDSAGKTFPRILHHHHPPPLPLLAGRAATSQEKAEVVVKEEK